MTEQLAVFLKSRTLQGLMTRAFCQRKGDNKKTWSLFLIRGSNDQQPLFEVFERKSWHLLNREAIELSDHEHRVAANDYIAEQLGLSDLRMCA